MAEHSQTASSPTPASRERAWLSFSLSRLFDRHQRRCRRRGEENGPPPPPHFDVLIVGSGYGGAIAAASLAGCRLRRNGRPGRRLRIAVLERGQEYLPGAFPSQLSDLPGHVRFSLPEATSPRGVRSGLFDVHVGADVTVVVANGLGGGSLINAGVMLRPHEAVLGEARWPAAIRSTPDTLDPFYARAAEWLGAGTCEAPNAVDRAAVPTKFAVMETIGKAATRAVPITVALRPGARSSAGVALNPCVACGDCATGCNHGAKDSLDVNLLVHARRHGVHLYTGATVLRLEKLPWTWSVLVTHTAAALRQRQRVPLSITADKVILAAGTFGSTEILLRSRGEALPMSTRLGQQFSGNGDLFGAAYDLARTVKAVADESVQPEQRHIGPTITAAIDKRVGDAEHDVSIQELAVPGPLRRLFEEAFTTARTLHSLGQADRRPHAAGDRDRNAVDHVAFDCTLPVVLISRDRADGTLVLASKDDAVSRDDEGDGAVHIRWPEATEDPRFDCHFSRAKDLLEKSGLGGRLLPNPVWKLVDNDVARTLQIPRGPLLSVHPLGGCPMGDDFRSGVVNHLGQAFTCDQENPDSAHTGLVVLDGSIVPTSLGINPALTIAAVALRAIETLRDTVWDFVRGPALDEAARDRAAPRPLVRPVLRPAPPPPASIPTKVELMERLCGNARLADGREHRLELTLRSRPVALDALTSPVGPRRIEYEAGPSVLRVFAATPPRSMLDEDPPGSTGPRLEACGKVQASEEVLQLAATFVHGRAPRAWWAWLWHRGLRDVLQSKAGTFAGLARPDDPTKPPSASLYEQFVNSLRIATRAGAKRTLEYSLEIRDLEATARISLAKLFGKTAARSGVLQARARKTLTYDGKTSPWTQLTDLTLYEFPGLAEPAILSLDLPYLARQGVAMLRVVEQQDHVHALFDMAALQLYLLRTALDGHVWSFRLPDRTPDRVINRLPGAVPGLPPPEITELKVAEVTRRGRKVEPVHLRLTRYRPVKLDVGKPPVLLIHGYSASGTTFAHPTLQPGLAGRLVQEQRDVWILDLRSSAGMPWRAHPWTFEQIGCEDIPLAIDHIWHVGRKREIDVVAHCMGSVMLCMALLADVPARSTRGDAYPDLRGAMKERIRHIVLSQVGPRAVMSPTNQARAFLMRYVRHVVDQLIPTGEYRFRPDGDGSLADTLLDRLLATLPYPSDEFRRENPAWPPWARRPWVRTRRRMDILYGQTFELATLSDRTLEYLDDFFGPMSVKTVSQVIHFARSRTITDAQGRHVFATRDRLRRLERYKILSIHGAKNGLVDVSTGDLLEKALGPQLKVERFRDFGHQDCLMGQNTEQIFDAIVQFLDHSPVAPAASSTAGASVSGSERPA